MVYKSGLISNCCGADMYSDSDICPDCKEHCEGEELDEPETEGETLLEITENIHNLAKEVQGGSPNDPFRKLAEASDRLSRKLDEIFERMESGR